jgi:hypothetical protein
MGLPGDLTQIVASRAGSGSAWGILMGSPWGLKPNGKRHPVLGALLLAFLDKSYSTMRSGSFPGCGCKVMILKQIHFRVKV